MEMELKSFWEIILYTIVVFFYYYYFYFQQTFPTHDINICTTDNARHNEEIAAYRKAYSFLDKKPSTGAYFFDILSDFHGYKYDKKYLSVQNSFP